MEIRRKKEAFRHAPVYWSHCVERGCNREKALLSCKDYCLFLTFRGCTKQRKRSGKTEAVVPFRHSWWAIPFIMCCNLTQNTTLSASNCVVTSCRLSRNLMQMTWSFVVIFCLNLNVSLQHFDAQCIAKRQKVGCVLGEEMLCSEFAKYLRAIVNIRDEY